MEASNIFSLVETIMKSTISGCVQMSAIWWVERKRLSLSTNTNSLVVSYRLHIGSHEYNVRFVQFSGISSCHASVVHRWLQPMDCVLPKIDSLDVDAIERLIAAWLRCCWMVWFKYSSMKHKFPLNNEQVHHFPIAALLPIDCMY